MTEPCSNQQSGFALAESLEATGDLVHALQGYVAYADGAADPEHAYVSLRRAARVQQALGRPAEEVLSNLEKATQLVGTRAEALCDASVLCFRTGQNQRGYEYACRGLAIGRPATGWLIDDAPYDYGLLDALAENAYWIGAYRQCAETCISLLANPSLPMTERDRVKLNARSALRRLEDPPALGSAAAENFIDQHRPRQARNLHSAVRGGTPTVLLAILAKQKEKSLPLYLQCIEALDYPKKSIHIYVRTNNNTDNTKILLDKWLARVGHMYASVEFDSKDVAEGVENFRVHEWNQMRFRVLAHIRNVSLERALAAKADFYFVCDVDNFIIPATLRELVALNVPIVAPFLRSVNPGAYYSNYHAEVDANGYLLNCAQYHWVLQRLVKGVIEMPVVHCTYLVRCDVIPELNYHDGSGRFEYVIFSEKARQAGIPQYLDNRQIYGYIGFEDRDTDEFATARALVAGQVF